MLGTLICIDFDNPVRGIYHRRPIIIGRSQFTFQLNRKALAVGFGNISYAWSTKQELFADVSRDWLGQGRRRLKRLKLFKKTAVLRRESTFVEGFATLW